MDTCANVTGVSVPIFTGQRHDRGGVLRECLPDRR
jgi:hypothetical protein